MHDVSLSVVNIGPTDVITSGNTLIPCMGKPPVSVP